MAAKRKVISLETKKYIIDDFQHGLKNSELCRKYNLDRTTVLMILKNKQNILHAIEKGAIGSRARLYKHSVLDEALLEWIKVQNSKNIPFDGQMLKKKALELSKQFPGKADKFVASNGWLVRFRARYSIKFTNIEQENGAINTDIAGCEQNKEGFAYTKHRLSVDGRRTYWRCERRSSLTGCHGRAVTIGNEEGQPVLLTVHHNHPPSEKYGPLTGGTGVHGWAIGGDVVGTSSSNTTPPPTNVRGVPIVPKISRCDIARTYGETVANSSRKRRFETPQFPFALSLPPFIGDGEPPNLTKAEDTPNSPQNCSSYSTLEQFINSHSDNNLPPFLESAQDNFNVEIAMKRPHLEDTNDGAELGELYSTEGFFDPNNESCKDNEHAAKLDLLKKEWEEFPSYDPSQPSSSSLASVQQSADALIKNSSSNQINNVSSSSFGGTALIREKSQLDFFLQLPINTEFTSDQHGCGAATNDMKQMPTTQEWENDPRTIELRKQLNDALDRERNSQHKLQKTADELLDARSEIDVKNAKNERLEKRLKNANDELASLREQLDQSMDHRETLERQQFELNLKESRKRTELQRELEAKEDEMEEMRIQFQRKIRNLESTLDDAQLEISSLLKQKKAAWQRNSQSVSMNGSLLDLAQNSNSPENRTLKGKLARAMALIQSSKIHFDKDSFEENSRNLKNNLGSSVFSSVCGGSESGDLEDVLMEEEGKEVEKEENVSISQPKLEDGGVGECASRETITSLLAAIEKEQQFDGANSDTIEGSSCGTEEIPASSNTKLIDETGI